MLSQDKGGKTKLYGAAKENRIEEAKKMMKEANDLNIVSELVNKGDNQGWTPLNWASRKGDYRMAQLMITNRAEIDKAANDGLTPLMLASYFGHLEVVNLLIEHQADVHLRNNDGETALDWARRNVQTSVEKALLRAGAK